MAIPGASADTSPRALATGGYDVVRWADNGFDYWAVSDLEAGELSAFVGDFRTATTTTVH